MFKEGDHGMNRNLGQTLVLMLVVVLTACGSPAAPAGTSATSPATAAENTTTSPATAAAETTAASPASTVGAAPAGAAELTDGKVVLAVLNDQSGVYAQLSGNNSVEAVKMAVEDFKAQYGDDVLGGSIEVISADHQNKPDLANSKAQEMYDRSGADVILDVPTSSTALAVANLAKEKKRLHINITAATTALTNDQCNKYTFHYAYDTYMLANGTGAVVTTDVGKEWYIIYPDYAFGQDMEKSFRAAIESNGGKIVLSDATPFPNDDFSTYLLKAPSLNPKPQVLGTMQAGGDLVNVVKQYNEFGLRDQGVTLAVGLMFITDIHALGADAFQGTVYTDAWYWNMDQEARAWADKFQARTETRPSFAHAGNYSAAMQYLEAIRRAGSDDADAVVEQLEGLSFNDFFARNARIRAEDHRMIHDVYLAEVKPAAEVKEEWDYIKILKTIPAEEAFKPVDQTTCNMPE
ncbi:MAG: ABC-type branched-chain amino acid transport systems, periplasmic component [uncultured Chloroflexia bacterium]|uniref:ABC-type branched-chain amino acid transport systems, periplasmic component n=1 Tax=uncultured Chloroflexia bacterium TaxID=1672391 RepID=A0A6J4IA90_9CHLR|nr:MAG: ABC-type branched-chain amino acid transport systems, periplasmic component [uncultured Chloroflexia bacterium]